MALMLNVPLERIVLEVHAQLETLKDSPELTHLFKTYEDVMHQFLNFSFDQSHSTRELLGKKRELLERIAVLCLPKYIITALSEHPRVALQIKRRLGLYIYTCHQEGHTMFLDLEHYDNSNELNGTLKFPEPDVPDENIKSQELDYPSMKTTKWWNRQARHTARIKIIKTLYRRIQIKRDTMTSLQKASFRNQIQALRPSKHALRAHYRAQGESEANIALLVTEENYPELPLVHVTKFQQKFLLAALAARETKYQKFIDQELS